MSAPIFSNARRFALGLVLASAALPALAATTVEYIHTDALGSPVAVTNAAGQVIERREYEPYGRQLTPALEDGPGYTGHVSDAATGLMYAQQRYYDPGVGRFLSVDPVTANGNTGSNFNRYWYANNNPYKFTDPDGRLIGFPSSWPRSGGGLLDYFRQRECAIVCLQAGGTQSETHTKGCDTTECDEYKAENRAIIRKQEETLKEAGVYALKEGAIMFGGGPVGRLLGRIGRLLGIAGKEISFGRNANQLSHTFRHIEAVGLDRETVKRAVQADLRVSASQIGTGKVFNQTINVDGVSVTYTAYRLEDGAINVGRITTSR